MPVINEVKFLFPCSNLLGFLVNDWRRSEKTSTAISSGSTEKMTGVQRMKPIGTNFIA